MSFLHLQHTRVDGEIDTYHLSTGRRYNIGRGSTCEVRILDVRMSRQHTAIETQGDDWFAIDLGSTNGCKVNGNKVQDQQQLKTGDIIELGATTLQVSSIDSHLQPDSTFEEYDDDDESGVSGSSTGEHLFVNLLGKRVGPIDRDTARSLKKKETEGTLTEDDIAQHIH